MLSLDLPPVISGCSCYPSGVNTTECPPGQGPCICDPNTGTCPCLPNVTGRACDRCTDGHWNLVPGRGCEPCDCDHRTSHGSHCDQARHFKVSKLILSISCHFSRISHFFKDHWFLLVLETKIWAQDDCACFICSPLPLHSSCLQPPTMEQTAALPHDCLASWFMRTPNVHDITLWHAS